MTHRMRACAYRDDVPGALLAAACSMASAQPDPYADVEGRQEPPEGRPMGAASSVCTAAVVQVWIVARRGQSSCVANAADGAVRAFIPPPNLDPAVAAAVGAHGLAANAAGETFGAEVGATTVRKYIRR